MGNTIFLRIKTKIIDANNVGDDDGTIDNLGDSG